MDTAAAAAVGGVAAAAVEHNIVDIVVDMLVVAARTAAVGLLLVVAVTVVAAEKLAKLEFVAASLLVRRNMLLLRKLVAGLVLALPEKLLADVLLASAVVSEEGQRRTAGFAAVELEGSKMRILVKTLGVDHEESSGIYRRQGRATVPWKSLRKS